MRTGTLFSVCKSETVCDFALFDSELPSQKLWASKAELRNQKCFWETLSKPTSESKPNAVGWLSVLDRNEFNYSIKISSCRPPRGGLIHLLTSSNKFHFEKIFSSFVLEMKRYLPIRYNLDINIYKFVESLCSNWFSNFEHRNVTESIYTEPPQIALKAIAPSGYTKEAKLHNNLSTMTLISSQIKVLSITLFAFWFSRFCNWKSKKRYLFANPKNANVTERNLRLIKLKWMVKSKAQ